MASSHADEVCGICFNDDDNLHAPPVQINGREKEHMERPERTRVIWDGLLKSGLAQRCKRCANA